jgi:hypothetical protein
MAKFEKGNIPHNKGKKIQDYVPKESLEKIKKTQFKNGENHAGENHPTWKGGVQKPKRDCAYLWRDVNKRERRPRVIYEMHYGKIPNGYVIFHKDQNKLNDDISNLEAISRKELLKRNKQLK